MAFTYDPDLTADRDKVRYYLRDITVSSGPLPDDANFSDQELDGLLTLEGSWQRAVAGGFEALASAWRRYPSFQADGLRLDRTAISNGYAKDAKQWRDRFGVGGTRFGARAVTRVDGYSDDVDSHDD